ncbi:MAG: ATP-binding protein [Candidatus Methanogranum gryphiswaldense]|nr:MAG: ATP-binding protein [Candidatus Methanogranum sp. U3.2.1]
MTDDIDFTSYFKRPLESITDSDVSEFVNNFSEGLNIEYKSIEILKKPSELSNTISAFANSSGGMLFIGVSEPGEGNDKKERKIEYTSNKTHSKDWLSQSIVDKVQPIVRGIRVLQIFDVSKEKWFFLICVPKSENIPHMTNNRYYHRIEARSVPMEHYHVSNCFNMVQKPVLIPCFSVNKKDNGDMEVTFKISNEGKAICKWPFAKVEFFGTLIHTNSLTKFNNEFGLRADRNPPYMQLCTGNMVLYPETTQDEFRITLFKSSYVLVRTTLAGENSPSKVYFSCIDSMRIPFGKGLISVEQPRLKIFQIYDVKELEKEYGLLSKDSKTIDSFCEIYFTGTIQSNLFADLSTEKKELLKKMMLDQFGIKK